MSESGVQRGAWKTRTGFILAASGSAVGLGNIWKFPYITGENGGGLFVLIYLVCIFLVGIPIMAAEIMIGRASQKQPVVAFHVLQGKKDGWAGIGWMGVICGFILLSYYAVIAGWAMDYTFKSVANFSEGIHAAAEKEATLYRATASMEEMREKLAERRANKKCKDRVTELKNEFPPSIWEAKARYVSALKDADRSEEARERLLEIPELAEAVRLIALDPETLEAMSIKEAREAALREARAWYEARGDIDVRKEAEDLVRRDIIGEQVKATFTQTSSDGWLSTFWTALFMIIVILVVAGGVSGGIERTCTVLMPLLILIILFMVIYGAFQPGFKEAVSFVFKPDVSKLKASGILEALGHAFFTLSLGMGAMITYGSYQRTKDRLFAQSVTIAGLDTGIALLACLMMFPILFSYGQEPTGNVGLAFVSMPMAFAEIGAGGMLMAILFFGLVVFAALTSGISLLEVVASYFIDERGWSRRRAAWLLGSVIFVFSLPSAFSLDASGLLPAWKGSYGRNFFDTVDYLVSNWMLPLGGLLISIYAGWIMPRRFRDRELEGAGPVLVYGWMMLVRFVAPLLVIVVLLDKVGILEIDDFLYHLSH